MNKSKHVRTEYVVLISLPSHSTFDANSCGEGGVVNTFHTAVHFRDTNIFANNIGSCVQVGHALFTATGVLSHMHKQLFVCIK